MNRVQGVVFIVPDMARAIDFFCDVLEFQEISRSETVDEIFETLYRHAGYTGSRAHLRLGEESIYLIHLTAPHVKHEFGRVRGNEFAFQHIAIVVSDMERAHRKLLAHGIQGISSAPQTLPDWNKAAAGIKVFYFRSPVGYPLELISYPLGKGPSNWQDKTHLFLGIDHAAITVQDTERSLRVYRDLLGLKVIGESLNYGETQEKLSGVVSAKVRITGLHSYQHEGIGLEFLHYLSGSPRTASSRPPHEQARIHLVIETEKFSLLRRKLEEARIPILAQGRVSLEGPEGEALIFQDPEGHRVLLLSVQEEK
jgi:catechol 2,3-dioxygenase-like lactoylglutathione lyase family enzyme